ncbi:unnamed protein product [Cylindrotheca closterium]|uniref:Uncharacterized protein n=1 Tax=Cylindrotheca closterium TaxID=2856 RepID=A0AAD2CQM4_9STRA|nr:unnamed protein product [Cylindrotheca closterium]
MGKSKNNKKVAIAAKPVNSTALTQGRISFSQKSRVKTAEIRSKKVSDNLDPPIHNNNNSDINMEEVEHPLKYDRIVPNIDLSQWNLQTLAYLCTIHWDTPRIGVKPISDGTREEFLHPCSTGLSNSSSTMYVHHLRGS